jgi:separase
MGCSSGRLRGGDGGDSGGGGGGYEPSGAIWAYLLAGCPAAVANLWDVTDRCAGGHE